MKLRNKKTGEIVDYNPTLERWNGPSKEIKHYVSLAELNAEWEDWEETKEFWFIDYDGGIIPFNRNKETATDKLMKSIGNYFETKEEAEKALEKLKAWKRLEDKGFEFVGWNTALGEIRFEVPESFFPIKSYNISCITDETEADLDLLFEKGEK